MKFLSLLLLAIIIPFTHAATTTSSMQPMQTHTRPSFPEDPIPPPPLLPDECILSRASLQVIFLQDLSFSMGAVLPTIKEALVPLLDNLATNVSALYAGVSSFVDKPLEPFGQADVDFCFKENVPLTEFNGNNAEAVVREALDAMPFLSGRDDKEDQLGAINEAVKTSSWNILSSDCHSKFVVVCTQASWHEKPDAAFLEGEEGTDSCENFDYSSRSDIAQTLKSSDVGVMFLVSGADKVAEYDTLLRDMNVRGAVGEVASDWTDFPQAFMKALVPVS